jgi:C1A family cysteine protease
MRKKTFSSTAIRNPFKFSFLFLGVFLLVTCKKSDNPDNNTHDDNAEFGLIVATSSEYASIATASLPPTSGTLSNAYFLPVPLVPFNQGAQGSCASCATAMTKSIVDHVKLNTSYYSNGIIYSPSYLYNQSLAYPGSCALGSQIYKNLDVLKDKGVCRISDMPYSDLECSTPPNSAQHNSAASHKIDRYFKIDPINRNVLKQFINAGLPIIVGFRCDLPHWKNSPPFYFNSSNKDEVWKSIGQLTATSHATLLYGWDDSKNAFRMLNQWGKDFGDNGSIWVDYSLLENKNVFFEAYIIQNPAVVNSNNLEVTGSLDFGNFTINTN